MSVKLSPEKNLEKSYEGVVLSWAFRRGIWLQVYDSKAKITSRGFYRTQGLDAGTPDLLGVDSYGYFLAIELKRPNKKPIPSIEQRNFLLRVIEKNGFGVVSNNIEELDKLYTHWVALKINSSSAASKLLHEHLPKQAYVRSGKSKKVLEFP